MGRDPFKVALGVVAGLTILACGGGGKAVSDAPMFNGDGQPPTTGAPAGKAGLADVTITSCGQSPNELLGPEAKVKIVNGSSKPSNYLVQIAFLSKDGATQLDTSSVTVNGLAPGQTSEQTASSFKAEAKQPGLTCKVLDVTRFAAG